MINAPFQVLHGCLLGLTEITRILSLECAFHCLARIETAFGQLHCMFVVNHRVLVGESMRIQTSTGGCGVGVLTRTKARIVLTIR
jgi:hypothetical protein